MKKEKVINGGIKIFLVLAVALFVLGNVAAADSTGKLQIWRNSSTGANVSSVDNNGNWFTLGNIDFSGIISGNGSGLTDLPVDLSNYYLKSELYNRTEVDSLLLSGDVNSSDFWDNLNSPADILGSQIQNNLNWINSTKLSEFVNDLGIGNWTAEKVNYYTKSETYNNTEIDSMIGGDVGNADTFDNYDSSFFMPLNKSVYGDFDFNGGWTSNGVSIVGGNVYAQSGYFYDINSLQVSTLTVNGSMIPPTGFDNQFDIGNSSLRWRDGYFGRNVGIGVVSSPQSPLEVRSNINARITINRQGSWATSPADVKFNTNDVGTDYWTIGMKSDSTNDFRLAKNGVDSLVVREATGDVEVKNTLIVGNSEISTLANGDVNVW